MTTYGERIDFFGAFDDRVIYDERKKRFVHTADMPGHMARQYYSSGFKSVSIKLMHTICLFVFCALF